MVYIGEKYLNISIDKMLSACSLGMLPRREVSGAEDWRVGELERGKMSFA